MHQSDSIFTPGSSIQGQLLQYALPARSAASQPFEPGHESLPVMKETVTQCGLPAVLPYEDGSLGVFVAGRVHSHNSPPSASWPLSPLYLHTGEVTRDWELTRLPDAVHDRPYFISGVPSVVRDGETTIAYFNGAQLLEYTYSPRHWWTVSPVPTPNIVVEANPVAIIAAGRVFVFAIPGGESLLMCSRDLATHDWQFADLGTETSVPFRAYDGDTAVTVFAGILHVVVTARLDEANFDLWDFMVDPATLRVEAVRISEHLNEPEAGHSTSIVGTPSMVADTKRLHVFARSSDGKLLHYSSMDGRAWNLTDVSISTSRIGGDPGAVLLEDGVPLVCAADKEGNLLQFSLISDAVNAASANWRATQLSDDPNYFQRRPIPVLTSAGLSVFDLKVAL
jgi:hypothetical protein